MVRGKGNRGRPAVAGLRAPLAYRQPSRNGRPTVSLASRDPIKLHNKSRSGKTSCHLSFSPSSAMLLLSCDASPTRPRLWHLSSVDHRLRLSSDASSAARPAAGRLERRRAGSRPRPRPLFEPFARPPSLQERWLASCPSEASRFYTRPPFLPRSVRSLSFAGFASATLAFLTWTRPGDSSLLFLRRRLTLLAPTPSGTLCFGYDQGHVLLSILQDRLIGRVEAS
jgi:hypothetical protein